MTKMNKQDLDFILQEGEGQFIEFKEKLSGLDKEMVAFANSEGGRIFLGVDDSGGLKGISASNKLISQVHDLANNCDPEIKIQVEEIVLENKKNILVLNIPRSKNKPHRCSSGFYLREGPNSQKMSRNEILKLSVGDGLIRFDEQVCTKFDWKDFDDEKFNYYLKLAGISVSLDKKYMLKNLKVLTEEGMTNAGVLFFAKNPYKYINNSKIRCVHFKGSERVDILDKKEVDRGIIGNIEFAISYIEERVPVEFIINEAKRKEFPEFPKDAYREAIVNAVVHRDYFIESEVAVEKLKNRIFVTNPGKSLTPEEELGKESKFRNRLIADLLSRTVYMEKVGTGINRIEAFCKNNDNEVEINPKEESFWISIFSNKPKEEEISGKTVSKTVGKTVSKSQENMLGLLKDNPYLTREELAKKVNLTKRGIEYNISKLKNKGVLKRRGGRKGGYWEIIKDD